ncbi:uncharacterized protein [Aegilops tauschii subsp. strangulata]
MARRVPAASPWAFLPSDLLLDISGHLHDAGDFVRFHAVCKPWRDTAGATRPMFLPWVIAPGDDVGIIRQSTVDFRGIYSKASSNHGYVAIVEPPGAPSNTTGRNWVVAADGTAASLFVAHPEPRLVELFTGKVTPLPPFPLEQVMEYPRGIVYPDGTIFLYQFNYEQRQDHRFDKTLAFTVSILRPGNVTWETMKKRLNVLIRNCCSAAYHNGEILVFVGANIWCFLTLNFEANGDNMGGMLEEPWNRVSTYVLDSRGELLMASIWVDESLQCYDNHHQVLSVTVHALKEVEGSSWKRWLRKDGRSLGDRLLFLGSPASFTMDAAQLGTSGGYVYFPFRRGMFCYNLANGMAKRVKRPRSEWRVEDLCVWLQPQPAIAPIQEIKESINGANE